MKTIEKINNAIKACNFNTRTCVNDRIQAFSDLLDASKLEYEYLGEVPHKGANFSIIERNKYYKVNVRCGYSRNNYAPVFKIYK